MKFGKYGKRPLNFFSLLVGLVLVGGFITGLVLTQQKQIIRSRATNNGSALSILPATKTMGVGETASFAVIINTNGDNVSAVQLEISYNTTALENVTFSKGTILPVVLSAVSVANGKIKATLASEVTSPYSGTGTVGTISVRTKSAMTSNLSFTANTMVAAVGKTGNTLVSKTGAAITAGTPGNTPTPTQTGAPTPTPTGGGSGFGALSSCGKKCGQLGKPSAIFTCITVCRDISTGTKQCPSACNTVPANFKNLCRTTLCPGN